MIIDLSSIDHDQVVRRQREARIRFKLNKMTVKGFRQFARENNIPLGGASSKPELVSEIMGQYGHAWKLKEEEIV